MLCQKTQLSEVIEDKEDAINERNDKTGLDDPGEGKFKFGLCQFFFNFGILFKGKLFGFFRI